MAAAIQQMEGWSSGSVSQRNNNPGNLRAGVGQIGTDSNGFAIFPDYATGYAALQNQITLNVNRGLTLNEFFGGKPGVYAGYAPASDNNSPNVYTSFVATRMGVDPNVPLSEVMGNLPSTNGIVNNSSVQFSTGFSPIVSPFAFLDIAAASEGISLSDVIPGNPLDTGSLSPVAIAGAIVGGIYLLYSLVK